MNHFRFLLLAATMLLGSSVFAQWASVGTGLTGNQQRIYSLSVLDANTFWGVAGGTVANGVRSFTRTIDGGSTFSTGTINEASPDYTNVHIFALSADLAYVVQNKRAEGDEARIFRTVDGGQNWVEQTGPFNQDGHNVKAVHFFNSNVGVAFGSAATTESQVNDLHIYRTVDGGSTWTEITNLPTTLPNEGTWTNSGNGGYAALGNTIWFGTTAKRVWKSSDRGETWTTSNVNSTVLSGGINSVAFRDANNGVAISEFGYAATTTDGGESWQNVASFVSTPVPAMVTHVPGSAGTYLACDGTYGLQDLIITNDNGNTWSTFIPEDEGGAVTVISPVGLVFLSPSQGFGTATLTDATQGGILEWDALLPGVTTGISSSSEDVAGLLAYPNPVQDMLYLRWESQDVQRIQLLNAQGSLIYALSPNGQQEASLRMGDLPAGLYVLQVQTNSQQETHQILHR